LKGRLSVTHMGLAILACLLWSTAFAGVKIGLQFAKPFSFAGGRFILAGIILLPFCGKLSSFFRVVSTHLKTILLVSFFQTFLLYGLFYTGMTLIPGALGAIVIGSAPLFSAVTAHFFMPDDEMSVSKMISIAIGICGVVIISLSRAPWHSHGLREFIGVVLLILGCVSSSIGNIIVARDKHHIHPLILNSVQIFIGGFFLLLVSIPLEGLPRFNFPASFYGVLLWLSCLSAVAISIWFYLLKRPGAKVSELNLWKFIIPVGGALLSWIILPDESPQLLPVVGMLCVAVSILWFNLSAIIRKT
jgi:drug/metabolite transporter (DMT)-like permease